MHHINNLCTFCLSHKSNFRKMIAIRGHLTAIVSASFLLLPKNKTKIATGSAFKSSSLGNNTIVFKDL